MKAAVTNVEKNKKLSKILKIEPCPKHIKDIIISRRLKYLKAHPKKKRKFEDKINFEDFKKKEFDEEGKSNTNNINGVDGMNTLSQNVKMDIDIEQLVDEIPDEVVDISKDEKIIEQNQQLEKLIEEEKNLQKDITANKEKIEEIEKSIETEKNKEEECNKKQQEIFQKIEELKSRKRKMYEMMKK